MDQMQMETLPSTKPYLLRALYEWCCDSGLTPHIAVVVDGNTQVPREFVRDGQIVFNIGLDATNRLQIANDQVTFAARFSGVAREIIVPIGNISAIYARENGAGMAFEVQATTSGDSHLSLPPAEVNNEPEPPKPPVTPSGRPHLQRIK